MTGVAPLPYWTLDEPPVHERRDEIVRGLFGPGEIVVISGGPGTGKSALAVHLLAAISTNVSWFQREVEGGAAIFIALERAAETTRRLLAFRKQHQNRTAPGGDDNHRAGETDAERPLPIAVVEGKISFFEGADDAHRLVQTAQEIAGKFQRPIKLIGIDTFPRSIVGADENSAKDIGPIVERLGYVARETGATVLLIHHTPHGMARMRGSTALLAAVDVVLNIEVHREIRVAKVIKANAVAEGEVFRFRLVPVEIGRDSRGGPEVVVPVVPVGDDDAQSPEPPRKASCASKEDRRADAILNLIIELATAGSVRRRDLLARARQDGIVSGKTDSGAEQMRKALQALQGRELITFDPALVALPKAGNGHDEAGRNPNHPNPLYKREDFGDGDWVSAKPKDLQPLAQNLGFGADEEQGSLL